MSRKNGIHFSEMEMVEILVKGGSCSYSEAIKVVEVIGIFTFSMMDDFAKVIRLINKGK